MDSHFGASGEGIRTFWAFGVSDGLGRAGFIWRVLVDVALENMGSMWLLEGKHTDPSIGFLGMGIILRATHPLGGFQPATLLEHQGGLHSLQREVVSWRLLCSPGVSKLLCVASKWEAEPGTQVCRKLLRQAALAPVLDLPLLL